MGRCRGRTADGYRPARNRGSRTRSPRLLPAPSAAGCCRSPRSARPARGSRAWRGCGWPSTRVQPSPLPWERIRACRPTARPSSPAAGSRSPGRARRSGRSAGPASRRA
ncbi:hypothetical protein G6F66_014806 [Rhizopus arrhizus]|nr:hypothetical protein G6F66_014806 [Rhizopus arrhizus]